MPIEPGLLAQISLLNGLPKEAQLVVQAHAQTKRFQALHLILAHHTLPAYLMVVLRGQLQKTEVSEDGRITGIGFVNPGQVLDWLSAVDGAPILYSVSTTQETDVLLLPIGIARQLLKAHSGLAALAMQQLASELRRSTEQRQLLTLPNAFQRVFVQIVHLAEQNPDQQAANLPKQHEIAAMVNTSRETVSRAIQLLVKNGILVKHGHRFVVQRSDQLKQLASTGAAAGLGSAATS